MVFQDRPPQVIWFRQEIVPFDKHQIISPLELFDIFLPKHEDKLSNQSSGTVSIIFNGFCNIKSDNMNIQGMKRHSFPLQTERSQLDSTATLLNIKKATDGLPGLN